MRILFDHQVFSWQRFGGISRYHAELIRGLREAGHEPVLPDNFFSENIYLREICDVERQPFSRKNFPGKKFFQNWQGKTASRQALREAKFDVFHPTYFDPYFLPTLEKTGRPFVLTIHDMIHEIYGHGSRSPFSLDAVVVPGKRKLAAAAAAIIAVSEHTKQDILKFYPKISPEKIHVIHHGNTLDVAENQPFRLDLPDPFLLFVGNREAYKNFKKLLPELQPTLLKKPNLTLLCAGGKPFAEDEKLLVGQLGLTERVRHFPFHSDGELAEIYRRASVFIFPSAYEGFGMPVVEAMSCGCPALLNRASCLPEVGGDAAAYFEIEKNGSLAAALQPILESAPVREKLRERGLERAKNFTWQRSVRAHLEVYESVLKY